MPKPTIPKKLLIRGLAASLLIPFSMTASALNIVLSNDDGLTSNVKALYSALKADGHDVIVSIPCQGQSGMGAAIRFLKPLTRLTQACLNNAGFPGDPGAGPVTKKENGFDYTDFYYVDGTPVMATAYGLDVLAPHRWNKPPDVVLSGPNEGRNAGPMINSSGTVSNVQFAAGRGLPAIALSAGMNTQGKAGSDGNIAANPVSPAVAALASRFLKALEKAAKDKPLLPEDVALNINFPDQPEPGTPWKLTRIGTYQEHLITFSNNLSQDPFARAHGFAGQAYAGVTMERNPAPPAKEQLNDEAVVSQSAISVSVMQVSFGHPSAKQRWLAPVLKELHKQELEKQAR